MKKFLALFVAVLATLVMVACDNDVIPTVEKTHDDVFDAINLPATTDSDVSLPTVSAVEGATLSWSSSHPSVLTATGKVIRGEVDVDVTLTLTVILSDVSKDKPYTIKVLKKVVETDPETNKFMVTFDSNEGTDVDNQEVDENQKVMIPQNPIKEGYEFLGWFLNDVAYDFDTLVTSDIVLIAKWEIIETPVVETFIVTFDTQSDTVIDAQIVHKDGKVEKPAQNPVKNGYVFINWYTDISGNQAYDFNAAVTADITLYAKWEPIETATIDDIVLEIENILGASLDWIEEDVYLPTTSIVGNAEISWASNDPTVLSAAGVVNKQYDATEVRLTLTITLDGETFSKIYEAWVASIPKASQFEVLI